MLEGKIVGIKKIEELWLDTGTRGMVMGCPKLTGLFVKVSGIR